MTPDETLLGIDEAFERRAGASRLRRARTADLQTPQDPEPQVTPIASATFWDRNLWMHLFLAVQFLWAVPMFFPGGQSLRFFMRALPFVSSLGLMAVLFNWHPTSRVAPGSRLLVAALLLLPLNLLHPTSLLGAGIAQCVFQLSIAAPLFWAHKLVRSPARLQALLVSTLIMNFAGAALGILQVYYPERFMPPQFNTQMAADLIESMTYRGSDGRIIIRPPGLSDAPGGAAIAGGLTAMLALGIALRTRQAWQLACLSVMAASGLGVIYLTQARSVLLMTLGAGILIGVAAMRQGRMGRASAGLLLGATLVVLTFWWATALGGGAIQRRFLDIRSQGAITSYQENRGEFVTETVGRLLDQYPFGAGLGRWGMMETYFADSLGSHIHVEVQLTGWLLDGGIPMWILYGGAIVASLFYAVRLSFSRETPVADGAPVVLAIQLFVVGMAMAGPAFNTQLGILFWTVGAALHGAARNESAPDDQP